MVVVELKDIRMHGNHGMLEGESLLTNPYLVNIKVWYDEGDSKFETIHDTVDYAEVFNILRQRMKIHYALLEQLADGIVRSIKHRFPLVAEIEFSIYKLQVAIDNLEGMVGVTLHKKFDD